MTSSSPVRNTYSLTLMKRVFIRITHLAEPCDPRDQVLRIKLMKAGTEAHKMSAGPLPASTPSAGFGRLPPFSAPGLVRLQLFVDPEPCFVDAVRGEGVRQRRHVPGVHDQRP